MIMLMALSYDYILTINGNEQIYVLTISGIGQMYTLTINGIILCALETMEDRVPHDTNGFIEGITTPSPI